MYSQAPTDADQLAQMRYMAILQRRASPPRCNPISILVLVMSLGMVFIGLTMTVIAHWPGSTSIGENPLKIAGPILLSVGGALFICGMFLVCFLNRKERKRWAKSVNNLAQSRITLNQSASSLPGTKGASKSGQKSYTSVVTMKGSQLEGSYPPQTERFPPDSSDSQRFGSFNYTEDYPDYGKKAGLMQSPGDPYGATTQKQLQAANLQDESDIPDPVRQKKKKKTLDSSSENLNAMEREELLNKSQTKYQDYSQSDEEVFNISVEGDANIPGAIRKKKKKNTKSSRENLNVSQNSELLSSSREYRTESVVEESGSRVSISKQYRVSSDAGAAAAAGTSKPVPPPTKAKPAIPSKPGKATVSQQPPPSPGEARRLRVHVRTQPGATVHIHQGSATPPQPAFAAVNKSSGSGETDL